MKLVPLTQMGFSAKLLITCFLLTLCLGNIAAGVYTQNYMGISYESMVETYSERDSKADSHCIPEIGGNESCEREISLDQIQDMPHKVDLKLLLQDAHVHLFSHGVLALLMGGLLLASGIPEKWKWALIPLPFLGGTLDFIGMFLLKFIADGFAYLILFAGFLTGISFAIVFFISMYEMWLKKT